MRTRIITFGLALFLMGLLAVPIQQASAASPPTVIPLHFDDTFVAGGLSNFCGFTIMRHDVGDGQIILRQAEYGDKVNIVIAHATVTLSANDKSIEGLYSGFDRDWFYADGSYTYLGVGTAVYVVLPGLGPVWGASGSLTFTIDAAGNVTYERNFGHDLFFSSPDVCSALAS